MVQSGMWVSGFRYFLSDVQVLRVEEEGDMIFILIDLIFIQVRFFISECFCLFGLGLVSEVCV